MSDTHVLENGFPRPCNGDDLRGRSEMPLMPRTGGISLRGFVVLSVVYFAVAFALSSMKLLWLDELITLHIAKAGGAHAIWTALERGADPNPPVTHLLVHYSRVLFGDHEWAYRLPAIIGYWVGLLSLYLYLRRRIPETWALCGTVMLMAMAAFEYSYESRSYGIFFGLTMLAYSCWIRATQPRTERARILALIGMGLALAAAISTNYFAVLAFFPIAFGEVARSVQRMRSGERLNCAVDWSVWATMLIAGSPLLAYRPLIEHSIAQFAPYAWNKVSLSQVADSYTEMVEIILYPLLGLFLFALITLAFLASSRLRSSFPHRFSGWMERAATRLKSCSPLPAHEIVAVLAFMLYPMLGFVIASIRGGMLSPRFVIPVCYGFAIAGIVIAYQLFGNLKKAGVALLCFLAAWFVCRESVVGYWYEQQKQSFYKVLDAVPAAEQHVAAGSPVLIPDPLLALTFQHYAPPSLAKRVVFPVDFPAIRDVRHDDSPEENLWAGRNFIYSLNIVPVADFQNSTNSYLIISSDHNWYLADLAHHHYGFSRLPLETRADSIGGFTPLAHGIPEFYTSSWTNPEGNALMSMKSPIPFRAGEELPNSTPTGATP